MDFECFDKALQETAKSLERFNTINNVSTDLPDLLKELVRNPLWVSRLIHFNIGRTYFLTHSSCIAVRLWFNVERDHDSGRH